MRPVTTIKHQKRFGQVVKNRRTELGLTRDEVQAAGGPADTTLARIEEPSPDTAPPRQRTLKRLDVALRWQAGGAARALATGTAPDPLESAPAESPDAPTPRDTGDTAAAEHVSLVTSVPVDARLVYETLSACDEAVAFMRRNDLSEAASADAVRVRQLLEPAARRLARAYASELLQRTEQ